MITYLRYISNASKPHFSLKLWKSTGLNGDVSNVWWQCVTYFGGIWSWSTLVFQSSKSIQAASCETCLRAYEDGEAPDQPVHLCSDQGLKCQITESLVTTECMNEEQTSRLYFTHALEDKNLHILRIFDGTFSLDATRILMVNTVVLAKLCNSLGAEEDRKYQYY